MYQFMKKNFQYKYIKFQADFFTVYCNMEHYSVVRFSRLAADDESLASANGSLAYHI